MEGEFSVDEIYEQLKETKESSLGKFYEYIYEKLDAKQLRYLLEGLGWKRRGEIFGECCFLVGGGLSPTGTDQEDVEDYLRQLIQTKKTYSKMKDFQNTINSILEDDSLSLEQKAEYLKGFDTGHPLSFERKIVQKAIASANKAERQSQSRTFNYNPDKPDEFYKVLLAISNGHTTAKKIREAYPELADINPPPQYYCKKNGWIDNRGSRKYPEYVLTSKGNEQLKEYQQRLG